MQGLSLHEVISSLKLKQLNPQSDADRLESIELLEQLKNMATRLSNENERLKEKIDQIEKTD